MVSHALSLAMVEVPVSGKSCFISSHGRGAGVW